jgi:hypothetical protein
VRVKQRDSNNGDKGDGERRKRERELSEKGRLGIERGRTADVFH